MSDSLWLSSANFPKCQEVVSVFSCQEEAEDESASRVHFEKYDDYMIIYDIMMHYCCNKAKEVQPHSSFGIFPEVAVSKKSVDCRVSDA